MQTTQGEKVKTETEKSRWEDPRECPGKNKN